MQAPTLYAILGIECTATREDIRKAYKQRALETHPDKLRDPSEEEVAQAEESFRQVREAFDVLSDYYRRRQYDEKMKLSSPNNMNPRWTSMSDKFIQRAKDREAWARQLRAQHNVRTSELHEQARMNREEEQAKWTEASEHAEMVQRILRDLRRKNPELEIRRAAVRQRATSNIQIVP